MGGLIRVLQQGVRGELRKVRGALVPSQGLWGGT